MTDRDERRKLNEEMIGWRHARFSDLKAGRGLDEPTMQNPHPDPTTDSAIPDPGERNKELEKALTWAVDVILERAGIRGGFTYEEAADLLAREVSVPFANCYRAALSPDHQEDQ